MSSRKKPSLSVTHICTFFLENRHCGLVCGPNKKREIIHQNFSDLEMLRTSCFVWWNGSVNQGKKRFKSSYFILKLVCILLSYPVLGTSTAAIYLLNGRSLYAPIHSDECHAWFHTCMYCTSRPSRSESKAKNAKWKILAHSGVRTNSPVI